MRCVNVARYKDKYQKRGTNSAIICVLSLTIFICLAIMNEDLTGAEATICLLSLLVSVVSFIFTLVFSFIYSVQKKKKRNTPKPEISFQACNAPITPSHSTLQHYTSSKDWQQIDNMPGLDFENWCADLLRRIGYTNVTVTQASGDQGVDILAEKDGVKYAIQCKCYSSDLGNTPVQEVNAGKVFYHCHVGVVLTNRHFTAGARELADATGVLLWDRDWIERMITITDPETSSKPIDPSVACVCTDELMAALAVVVTTNQASVSMLQRKLNWEYAKSAHVMDRMEQLGFVGPFIGSKPRQIHITKTQWQELQYMRHS